MLDGADVMDWGEGRWRFTMKPDERKREGDGRERSVDRLLEATVDCSHSIFVWSTHPSR